MSILRCVRSSAFLVKKHLNATPALCLSNTSEKGEFVIPTRGKNEEVETVSVQTSILYLKSEAFKKTYGDDPVWTHYRRNFKGSVPPKTRKNCVRNNKIMCASPCPICRDKYLVVDYTNVELLKHFFPEHGYYLLSTKITGVCQKQQYNLEIAVARAKDCGYLTFDVPHRRYDYNYYKNLN